MRMLSLVFLLAGAALFSSCDKNDLAPAPTFTTRPWRTDVVYVDATNTPERQIERFVAANNIDTTRTASGLVYVIDTLGGDVRPTLDSTVTVYYKGYLVNGRVFDESRDGYPSSFKLSKLIPAWREGIPYLGAGGKMWMLARPSIAYGNNPPAGSGITAESVLVFEIELVEP